MKSSLHIGYENLHIENMQSVGEVTMFFSGFEQRTMAETFTENFK